MIVIMQQSCELFKFEDEMAQCGRWFTPTVTTNYDLVFERCAKELNIEHRASTGFQKLQNMDVDKMLPLERIILEGDRYQGITYLKLHGSINWWIRDSDKRVVERNEPLPGTSLMGDVYNEQLMIYPIYEKYVSRDIFFSLYYYFRKLLHMHSIYVVIGYSFRDPSINNAFADALRSKSNSRLIIVNSNKKNIQERIDQYFSKSEDKLDILDTSFGDSSLFEKLRKVAPYQKT